MCMHVYIIQNDDDNVIRFEVELSKWFADLSITLVKFSTEISISTVRSLLCSYATILPVYSSK